MPVYSWLLCTLLIGQAADGQPLVIPAQAMPGGGINNAPPGHPLAGRGTTNKAARATADQLLAEALTPPAGNSINNQHLPLLSAIASFPDRPRQREAIHGYWRLVQAVGDFHYCTERQQRLSRLTASNDEAGDLRTARAVATARLHEAELRVTTAAA